MTIKSRTALLLAAFLGTTILCAGPAFAADKEPTVSRAVGKQLQAAITALTAGDAKGAVDAIKAAQVLPDLTDFDKYKINEFLAIADNKVGDTAEAETAAVAAADSPVLPDADKSEAYIHALVISMSNKHYTVAIKYGRLFEALGQTDPRVTEELLEAYLDSGDTADTQIYLKKVLDADAAAGRMPDEALLDTQFKLQVQAKDQAGALKTLETLAVNYNETYDWEQLIDVMFGQKGLGYSDVISLGRLLYASPGTVPKDDATIVAETAEHLAYYGDVQTSVNKGAKPVPGLAGKIAADKKGLDGQIAQSGRQGGLFNAKLADVLYGYGRYAEAEAAARIAVAKGGNPGDTAEAPMVLGEALFAQGKYAEAAQVFGGVKGGGPVTARIAEIWHAYAEAKARPAAAAAPATAAH